ncbi:hypothetical protein ACVOMV_32115 [Mesorhizobium atlanticum]
MPTTMFQNRCRIIRERDPMQLAPNLACLDAAGNVVDRDGGKRGHQDKQVVVLVAIHGSGFYQRLVKFCLPAGTWRPGNRPPRSPVDAIPDVRTTATTPACRDY